MEIQNERSLGQSREMDHCLTWNQLEGFIEGGLGETGQEIPKYYSNFPNIFNIDECVGRRHFKEVVGQIG